MRIENRLARLGYMLPKPPKAVGVYVAAIEVSKFLYTSGVTCLEGGELKYRGNPGSDLTVQQGRDAARCAMLNLLSVVKQKIGSLDRIDRVVRVSGFVASALGFNEQPQVIDWASEMLEKVFGERGRHARLAIGVNALPSNIPVEIEMITRLKD